MLWWWKKHQCREEEETLARGEEDKKYPNVSTMFNQMWVLENNK